MKSWLKFVGYQCPRAHFGPLICCDRSSNDWNGHAWVISRIVVVAAQQSINHKANLSIAAKIVWALVTWPGGMAWSGSFLCPQAPNFTNWAYCGAKLPLPSLLPLSLPFSTSRTSRKIGDMAFSVAAPRASAADRLETHAFESKLKSFMFHAAYSGNIV